MLAEVVICGAGIAGVSAAYHLTVHHGMKGVVLVDERPPLSLTSANSAECYRNWWPGPGDAMIALMDAAAGVGAGEVRAGPGAGLAGGAGVFGFEPAQPSSRTTSRTRHTIAAILFI
jgi:glycine/D-amino acid oxidase-like deaminating enzyme